MNCLRSLSFLAVVLALLGNARGAESATDAASLAIQKELAEPFCYFRAPTDQIGFKNSPKATIVTYDGAFVSAYGQLSFYAGKPDNLRPINQRVKTFLDGYIPVIQFGFDRDGLRYDFEAFATPIGLDPRNNLITFIQCTVSNPGAAEQAAILGVNFGDIASEINVDAGYERFKSQRQGLKRALGSQRSTAWHSNQFMDAEAFNASKMPVSIERILQTDRITQAGHLVFTAPDQQPADVSGYTVTPFMPAFDSKFKEAALQYDFKLKPGEKRTFRFKMPAVPVVLTKTDAINDVMDANANYDDYRAKTIAFWKAEVAQADRFFVDDPKVMNVFKTSLVNDLIASEVSEDGRIYQRVNKIQYDHFWVRDGSFFVRTYDMLGLHEQARKILEDFLVWRDGKPVGFFKPGARQPAGARLEVQEDYWGQVLWAFGAHFRTTSDRALLEQIYPLLGPHIDEFVAKCAQDPRGLWPVAGPYDNELINGHYTGHSFFALLGLKYAVAIAHEMGRPDDAKAWQKVHDDYEANFLKQLREIAAKTNGYIPPGMDDPRAGNDWDNASGGLYPFEVLAKDDPLALQTLAAVRNFNYQEGIITYGGNAFVAQQLKQEGKTAPRGRLHHYEIFYVTEGNTILGEQRKVVEDLYSILAHTGSTNSGFEVHISPWGSRDPDANFTPHGWFAARYMSQIRNLLVREEGTQVHIASVLAPLWVKPGKQIKVTNAPTYFGSVSYVLDCRADGATLTLDNHWKATGPSDASFYPARWPATQPIPRGAPSGIVLHLPWFVKVTRVEPISELAGVADHAFILRPDATRVELTWTWKEQPNLSYDEAVRLYLEKYYRKPAGADYDFLFPVVRPPTPTSQRSE